LARDRFATRAAILESAASLIAAHGVAKLGVNALADAAGCDKVLIYRYFGGLDGVLSALAEERMLWPRIELDAGGDESLADAVNALLLEEWAALSSGALILQSAAAEIPSHNPLGAATAKQRADRHREMAQAIRQQYRVPPYVDLAALIELLSAALTLFALRVPAAGAASSGPSAVDPHAVDPATPAGWRRIERTVSSLIRAFLEA
jgi:AcrR family transcriptional regulator